MADFEERVTSTTSLEEEEEGELALRADLKEAAAAGEPFDVGEIVDLIGGAQDAIERHIAEDTAHKEPAPQPPPVSHEPDSLFDAVSEPVRTRVTQEWDDVVSSTAEEAPAAATPAAPAAVEEKSAHSEPEEPQVAAAAAPPPPATPEPSLPSPPTAAASSSPTAATTARAEEPTVAAASYEPSLPNAPPASLMHFPTVSELLYWRDVKSTGVVFGAALLLLLSLTACSIVSVVSYVALALLSVTISFRIYKGILQAVQKSDEGHPFKQYLDQEVALSEEAAHKYSDLVLARLNKTIIELRRLFLVDDLVDSIKFAVLMWILTYVGALFNGLTLIILGLVAVFSCPIVYEKHQVQIDSTVEKVNNQIKDIVAKIQAKVPGAKRKAE